MLGVGLGALAPVALRAQAPLEDLRNTRTPDPNTPFVLPVYRSRREWLARRTQLRRQILSAAGLLPLPERGPLHANVVWRTTLDGIPVETVLLETLPGYYVGGNVYVPPKGVGRMPGVLSPHGHWKRGRLENLPSYSVPAFGINLARQGYVVFAWDMVGYNDTRQTPHDFGGWREQLWSFNPLGLQLWNSIRAVDYMQSRADVDPRRIAVTGASGGGTQTFLLTAVDNRIRACAPVNMVSAHMQGGDPCEEAPGLRLGTCNVEFAAMAAPRPMLMVSCTGDWTSDTPKIEFPAVRSIYALFDRANRVENAHFDGGHNFNSQSREAVYRFLAKHLRSHPEKLDLGDRGISPPADDELLALRHTSLPPDAVNYESLFEQWRNRAAAQIPKLHEDDARRTLSYALGAEWPAKMFSVYEGERLIVSREGERDRVSGIWIPGEQPPALIVHPEGGAAARQMGEVERILQAGRFAYLIDAFQTGSAVAPRNRSRSYFLSYSQTDDANRVQDILTALAFLRSQTGGTPELIGFGRAAVWCLFAAAVAPVPVRLNADLGSFRGTDEDFRDQFFVPGIQRAGGLTAAQRLAL